MVAERTPRMPLHCTALPAEFGHRACWAVPGPAALAGLLSWAGPLSNARTSLPCAAKEARPSSSYSWPLTLASPVGRAITKEPSGCFAGAMPAPARPKRWQLLQLRRNPPPIICRVGHSKGTQMHKKHVLPEPKLRMGLAVRSCSAVTTVTGIATRPQAARAAG
jgi:hypothetical protein